MKTLQQAMKLLVFSSLFAIVAAYAQTDIPSNGSCFYRDTQYRGSYFCSQSGQSLENLPGVFNDAIRSVRIFGNAQVTIFGDSRLAGASASLRNDVPDLRQLQLATDPSKNWSERISSLRVDSSGLGNAQNRGWDYIWGRRPTATAAASGACFFDQTNFRGRSFCVDQGQALNNLPSGFNDRIQSIQVRGSSEVQIFNDNDFAGAAARTSRDVADLRSWNVPDDPSRSWSGRISSLRVDSPRRGRWNNIGGYDRDRNDEQRGADNQPLMHCSSQTGVAQQTCNSQGYVRDARMINSYGTCRKNVSWGIDNGRLWVSSGCSADFTVER